MTGAEAAAPAPRLTAVLAGSLKALRHIGRPRAVAALGDPELMGYAAATACLLHARAWTLRSRQPAWRAVQHAWRAAIGDAALRDRLAPPLPAGTRFELVAGGAAAFERRAQVFAGATRTLDVASYDLQADATGRDTVRALAGCARRGVRVRLLVDRIMSARKQHEVPGTEALLAEAAALGIAVQRWHDPRRPWDSAHRKVIVADDALAVIGGRNFADHYRGEAWRDLDLLLHGPPVAALARLFDASWHGRTAEDVEPWLDHRPDAIEHDAVVRFALAAIGCARERVVLELAYLVAQPPLLEALAAATARGVDVRVLTNSPESSDLPFARWTCCDAARRLLEAGCALRWRRGAGRTLHTKLLVVDGCWVSIGSHNLDYYSSRWCCETNLAVHDAALAAALGSFFDTGWHEATPANAAEVQAELSRSAPQRLFDRVFRDFQ